MIGGQMVGMVLTGSVLGLAAGGAVLAAGAGVLAALAVWSGGGALSVLLLALWTLRPRSTLGSVLEQPDFGQLRPDRS
jgi:hypothetical protein